MQSTKRPSPSPAPPALQSKSSTKRSSGCRKRGRPGSSCLETRGRSSQLAVGDQGDEDSPLHVLSNAALSQDAERGWDEEAASGKVGGGEGAVCGQGA